MNIHIFIGPLFYRKKIYIHENLNNPLYSARIFIKIIQIIIFVIQTNFWRPIVQYFRTKVFPGIGSLFELSFPVQKSLTDPWINTHTYIDDWIELKSEFHCSSLFSLSVQRWQRAIGHCLLLSAVSSNPYSSF